MIRYGQYCPIAKALELLAERWTLLIVRELLMGSRHFNELRRGMPLIAPSVMSQRLKMLAHHGIVAREPEPNGHAYEYHLTAAGEELRPLIVHLGTWGQRWSRSKMAEHDLDASLLMWDIRRNVKTAVLPPQAVLYFEFPDAKKGMKHWWLVVAEGEVDLCLEDPGREVDITLVTGLRAMTQIWMGDISLAQARAQGLLKVVGAPALVRSLASWLGPSPFAHVLPAVQSEAARATESAVAGH